MKKTVIYALLATASLGAFAQSTNQVNLKDPVATKLAVETQAVSVDIKLIDVNKEAHTVTIEGLDGKPTVYHVANNVDLSKFKSGDVVKAAGASSVVLSVMKVDKNTTPGAAEVEEVVVSGKGAKDKFVETVKTLYVTAKVTKYDKKTNRVTIETASHNQISLFVSPAVKELANGKVKVGDEVMIKYTQGFIVGVDQK